MAAPLPEPALRRRRSPARRCSTPRSPELISERAGRREPGPGGRDAGRRRDRLHRHRRTRAASRWASLAAALAGGVFNLVFAFLVIAPPREPARHRPRADVLPASASARCMGARVRRQPDRGAARAPHPGPRRLPVVGRRSSPTTRSSTRPVPLAVLLWWVLFRTRWGLGLRAVGENPGGGLRGRAQTRTPCSTRRCSWPGCSAASPARTSRWASRGPGRSG